MKSTILSDMSPARQELPASLQRLVAALDRQIDPTPASIRQSVLEAGVRSEDLLPWADFQHPIADSYGRKLVCRGGRFEIMVMSWAPGDFSAIHDHGAAEWGAVLSFGRAEHYIYKLEGNALRADGERHFLPGTANPVDRDLIHQMGNPSNESFLSLHVYGCDRPQDEITGNARIFDLFEETIQYTNGGVFFCLPEEQILARGGRIRGDEEIVLCHHRQMRDRIDRMLSASPCSQPQHQLREKRDLLNAAIARLQVRKGAAIVS